MPEIAASFAPASSLKTKKAYLELTAREEETLHRLGDIALEKIDNFVDQFLSHLRTFPETRKLIEDPGLVFKLKEVLPRYWRSVFYGPFDEGYARTRIEMAMTHYKVKLPPEWYIGGCRFFQERLLSAIAEHYAGDSDRLLAATRALGKILALDILLFLKAYFTAELEARKKVREELHQKEKLSAIGKVIAGVAHDLNNPLAGVLGFSELLLGTRLAPDLEKRLRRIHEEAIRCRKIVENLLTIARKHQPEKKPVGINGIISKVVDMREDQHRLGRIRVVRKLQNDLPLTAGDYHQLQQVFFNLITNAEHAVGSRKEGREIRIVTRATSGTIQIRISDNGPGIRPQVLDRIFDPFFTTKPAGEGTGLGLSICFGIIQGHGGRVFVESEPGQGSTFIVEIPIRKVNVSETAIGNSAPTGRASLESLSVLVVDDEDVILDIYREILPALGCRIRLARSAESALKRLQEDRFDLIIYDFHLQGMSPKEFLDNLRSNHSHLANRIIYSSGDTVDENTLRFVRDAGSPFLPKPFLIRDVEQAIHKLINPVE